MIIDHHVIILPTHRDIMGNQREFRRSHTYAPIGIIAIATGSILFAVFALGETVRADSSTPPPPQVTKTHEGSSTTSVPSWGISSNNDSNLTPGPAVSPSSATQKATPSGKAAAPTAKATKPHILNGNGGGQPNTGTVSGSGSGSPVIVSWSVTADGSVQVSNLSITITGGGCNASTDVSIPTLNDGQSDSGTWDTGCTPTGSYTITLCWSTGNGNLNCNIASSSTSGGTVPTFGSELFVLAALLLGVWLWRN